MSDNQLVGCIDCGNQIEPNTEGHYDGLGWHCGCTDVPTDPPPWPKATPHPIRFEVDTKAGDAWMWNRNGHPSIIGIVVWNVNGDDPVHLEGVATSGRMIVNGGFRITHDQMDMLALMWLRAQYPEIAEAIGKPKQMCREHAIKLLREAIRADVLARGEPTIVEPERFHATLDSHDTIGGLLNVLLIAGYSAQSAMQLLLEAIIDRLGGDDEIPALAKFAVIGFPKE